MARSKPRSCNCTQPWSFLSQYPQYPPDAPEWGAVGSFTKPPQFQKDRLTDGGNTNFESLVAGKYKKREIVEYTWHFFQIPPWLYILYAGTAYQNWFSVVVYCWRILVYTKLPCLCIFPLHGQSFWDCLCLLAHTFCIGSLLLRCGITAVVYLGRNWPCCFFLFQRIYSLVKTV